MGMLFTVSSGILESDLFTGLTFLQMTMQVLLFDLSGSALPTRWAAWPSAYLDDPVATCCANTSMRGYQMLFRYG